MSVTDNKKAKDGSLSETVKVIVQALLLALVVRTLLFQPFNIPSGSMMNTLLIGDYLFVSKYSYGYSRYSFPFGLAPFSGRIWGAEPERGDVVVFKLPSDNSTDYIKRVVGLPGDEVAYLDKRLTVNGQPVPTTALPDFFEQDSMRYFRQFEEQLGTHKHRLLNSPEAPAFVQGASNFKFRDQCRYSVEGVTCKVPEGHYFLMGDNRDNSLDSRYWGFVPDENIVGKAFFVWMNFGNLKRIGSFN